MGTPTAEATTSKLVGGRRKEDPPAGYDRVLAHELDVLGVAPDPTGVSVEHRKLVGLALSGGGIRSATFNLGVLQGLAKKGLLPRFHYLSTVSGGGYIGTWLQAWLWRLRGDETATTATPIERVQGELASDIEPEEVRFLREHSNYLTPKVGLLSADTWTIASIYLRNLLLNLTIMTAAIGSIVCALRAFTVSHARLAENSRLAFVLAAIFLGVAVLSAAQSLSKGSSSSATNDDASGVAPPFVTTRTFVTLFVVAPLLLTCWVVNAYVRSKYSRIAGAGLSPIWLVFIGLYMVSMWVPAAYSWLERRQEVGRRQTSGWDIAGIVASTVFAAALAGVGVFTFAAFVELIGSDRADEWYFPAMGSLVLILIIGIVMALHVGIAGSALSEQLREWQARFVALLIGWGVLLAIATAIAFAPKVPESFERIRGLGASALPAWVTTSLATLWATRTSGDGQWNITRLAKRVLLAVGPYVFALGLLVSVAFLMDLLIVELGATDTVQGVIPSGSRGAVLPALLAIALMGVAAALSTRFGINDFSIGALYRNRLVRCYLGAIHRRGRRANAFTGFAESDDRIRIADLDRCTPDDPPEPETRFEKCARATVDRVPFFKSEAPPKPPKEPHPACRPYMIYNATLNLVGGRRLAWQRRRARPFVFTPGYCGFALSRFDDDVAVAGTRQAFRPSAAYAGNLSLGSAMSISGAAVTPNMGDRTTALLSFLLTVFNLRLGRWLPNPRDTETWQSRGPMLGLVLLAKELLGLTQDESRYVYVSDGGHFENLGIYELVRRRCRFIVASDAGQDPLRTFDDLGNAIERIRTDLGIDIDLDLEPLRLDEKARSRARCAVGVIHYDEDTRGYLVYIKATLTGGETTDISRYVSGCETFPHETTADQWFDETQFECYRRLGEQTAEDIFGAVGTRSELADRTSEDIFLNLRKRWQPETPHRSRCPRHTEELNRIIRSLREDERLTFLAYQLFPEFWQLQSATCEQPDLSNYRLPSDPDVLWAGLLACTEIIRSMETVYLDLELDVNAYFEHPDNRGWVNMVRHWRWSPMFQVSWALSASSFGARFQTFCEQRFGLGTFEIELRESLEVSALTQPSEALRSRTGLNFHELDDLRHRFEAHDTATKIIPLAIRIALLGTADANWSSVLFNCGLAVVRHRKLAYLRIQDHLRSMGIGRRCLAHLFDQGIIEYLPGEQPLLQVIERPTAHGTPLPDQPRMNRFRAMLESVEIETKAERRPRP